MSHVLGPLTSRMLELGGRGREAQILFSLMIFRNLSVTHGLSLTL